ncbi:MAG: DUF5916 domain-containing protein [Gemmatimonadales bacterium]
MIVAISAAVLLAVPPDTARPVVHAIRRDVPIQIDGRLDEAVWLGAPSVARFTQSTPVEGAPASEEGRVWIAFDDEALYVAARYDDRAADSIMAYLVRRDRSNQSDLFLFYVAPANDGQSGYQFIVNGAGVQRDGTLFADNFADDTWDGVWESAVHRDEGGWSIEARIPLSQLRIPESDRPAWGVNVGRGIGRRNEVSYLVPRPRQGTGFVSRFARLEGLEGLAPRPRREVLPYVTQRADFGPAVPGDPFFDGSKLSAGLGLDFRLGLGRDLQLDGTVNPDFGQVEVDPAVVNLTAFETFFQERRPFFVEGTNIFRFGQGGSGGTVTFDWPTVLPFYSRRVGRPPQGTVGRPAFADLPSVVTILGASKLTGKVGAWDVGTLAAVTAREQARIAEVDAPTTRLEVEPLTAYGSFRAQRAFAGGRHGLGVMGTVTDRAFDAAGLEAQLSRSALFGGVDGWVGLDGRRTWVLLAQGGYSRVSGTVERIATLARSSSHYFQRPDASHVSVDPTATSLGGFFGRVQLEKQRGSQTFHAGLGAISPGFEINDLGFASRTDVINGHVMTGRRWTRPSSWYQSAHLSAAAFASWDFGGTRTRLGFAPSVNLVFRNFSSAYLAPIYYARSLDVTATRGGPAMARPGLTSIRAGWSSDLRKPVSIGMNGFLSLLEDADAPSWQAGLDLELRPTTSVNLSLAPYLSRSSDPAQFLRSAADTFATATYGRRYLFGNLDQRTVGADLRGDWIFSPKMSLEVYLQALVSSVRYDAVRELLLPRSFALRDYGTAGSTFDRAAGVVDPDGAGPAPAIAIGQPDFTFSSMRGNAVFRWEFATGSTLYVAWTQTRALRQPDGRFRPGLSLDELFGEPGESVLLVKASYWLGR